MPELILIDSSHYGRKKNIVAKATYMHTPTKTLLSRKWNIENGIKTTGVDFDYRYDLENEELKAWTKNYYAEGKLIFIDTIIKKIGNGSPINESGFNQPLVLPDISQGTIMYDGRLFTGEVQLSMGKTNYKRAEVKYYKDAKTGEWGVKTNTIEIERHDPSERPINYNWRSLEAPEYEWYKVTNGVFNGQQSINAWPYGHDYNVNYTMGKKSGIERSSRYFKDEESGQFVNRNIITLYKDGNKEGTRLISGNYIYNNDDIISFANFEHNMLNGEAIYFNNTQQPDCKVNFRNDTLDGVFKIYSGFELTQQLSFKNGLPEGEYKTFMLKYESSTDTANPTWQMRRVLASKVNFTNGILNGTSKFCFPNGNLKVEVSYDIKDSLMPLIFRYAANKIYYPRYNAASYPNEDTVVLSYDNENLKISYTQKNIFEFNPALPGHYKYYYSNGVKSQEGDVVNKYRVGWWKYWNENGILMKEIEYLSGQIPDPSKPGDTLKYLARIKSYYPNGKFMMEGYVINQNFSYECVQDDIMAYEEVFYMTFYNEKGDAVFANYSGNVKDFHLNGNIRREGMIEKGQKSGIWKTYTPDGTLTEIGVYVNGKKDGLWLSGDLSGINFIDNQCFAINSYSVSNGSKLDFEELVYKNGEVLKYTKHEVKKE